MISKVKTAVLFSCMIVITATPGFTSDKKDEYPPSYFDRCEGQRCRDGTHQWTDASESWTSTPCGPLAIRHTVNSMCGHGAVFPHRKVVRIVRDWGIPDQGMAKRLEKNFSHPKNRNHCPAGLWRSYNSTSHDFISNLDAATTGGRVALVTTQDSTISTMRWYMVEQVEKVGSDCTVYVKDGGGRGTFSCERFHWLADNLFDGAGTPDHTIVWFERYDSDRMVAVRRVLRDPQLGGLLRAVMARIMNPTMVSPEMILLSSITVVGPRSTAAEVHQIAAVVRRLIAGG